MSERHGICLYVDLFELFVKFVLARYVRSHPVHLLGAKPPLSLKPSDAPALHPSEQILNCTTISVSVSDKEALSHMLRGKTFFRIS